MSHMQKPWYRREDSCFNTYGSWGYSLVRRSSRLCLGTSPKATRLISAACKTSHKNMTSCQTMTLIACQVGTLEAYNYGVCFPRISIQAHTRKVICFKVLKIFWFPELTGCLLLMVSDWKGGALLVNIPPPLLLLWCHSVSKFMPALSLPQAVPG